MRDSGAGMPTSFSRRMTSSSVAFSGLCSLSDSLIWLPTRKTGIQRRARFLKNIAHHAAANSAQFAVRHFQHVAAIQQNFPADVIGRRRRHELRDGQRGHALAAAAFADQADGFARADGERHAVHGAQRVRAGAEVHFQIFDFEQRHFKFRISDCGLRIKIASH